ncbi:hypothetical protein TeGR_g665, partial [Tetraparma gracilis]
PIFELLKRSPAATGQLVDLLKNTLLCDVASSRAAGYDYGVYPLHSSLNAVKVLSRSDGFKEFLLSEGEEREVHRGIYCDVCRKYIFGTRFKSTTKKNYDLCQACKDKDESGDTYENPPGTKVKRPSVFPLLHRVLAEYVENRGGGIVGGGGDDLESVCIAIFALFELSHPPSSSSSSATASLEYALSTVATYSDASLTPLV